MAASKDLLTVDAEHNGDTLDYNHSDMDDNYDSTLVSKYSTLGKNDSLKSTRSLSVFRDPNASKTMARSEEMTYNIYEDGEGGEPPMTMGSTDGRTYIKSSEASRSRGTFQMKTATSPTAVPQMTSDSLRNSDFKASLANTLTRRLSSEGNMSGSESRQNGFSHLVSMDPGGRSSAKGGSSSVSSTLESTGSKTARKDQWNTLSSAASTSTLTSIDEAAATADMRGGKSLVDLSQSEAETDTDRYNSGRRSGAGYSSDQDSEVVSHSLPRYSPAEIDVSNSKVKDKDFKAKMAAIFGGSGTTSPVPTSAPASLVRSRKRIGKVDSSDNDTESRTSTLSRDLREVATPADSLHSTLEGRASDAQSQRSTTPSDLRDVITQGKVNKLAGELAIKGVPLTGRSMDASSVSSMERQPSRASNQSDGARDQSKKFKYSVEGIDRPSESEGNTTMESEDDARIEQKRKMRMNLLQEIKNHSGTVEQGTHSGDGAQSDHRSRDGDHTPSVREDSPVVESREETTTTQTSSMTSTTTAGQSHDGSVENNIDGRSTQESEWDETDGTIEEDEPPLMRSSDGSAQMAGRSDREGTSVSVEITDGSETGHSYNLEDSSIRGDDEPRMHMGDDDARIHRGEDEPRIHRGVNESRIQRGEDEGRIQDENDSTTTDDQKTTGQHVVTLHLTGDNDTESNDVDVSRDRSVEEEEDTAAAAERKDRPELNQSGYSSSASAADNGEQRTLRHRMTAADRMTRIPGRPLSEDEPIRGEDREVVLSQKTTRDGTTLDNEEFESQLTEGSDYSGRQRGKLGGRPKIDHKMSNESTSESYAPRENQRPRVAGSDTGRLASPSNSVESPQRPAGRKIMITGRENIRRITPMNDLEGTEVQEGSGRRELGRALSDDYGGYPQPSPRKSLSSDVPIADVSRDRSQSFDRQVTNESGGHISFSSDDFPEARTAPSPVWTHPHQRDDGTAARDGNNGGLIIRISPDHDASWNSRRSLTDSDRGRQGLYEQNRRRSRQRKASRQVTDSSLTDQEDYENAGNRSSVMRRRMKRQMSRQSVESDTEDPAIYSEPEYIHRETHVSQRSTPVTGLISYGRPSSRSEMTRRSPSVPPPTTHFRPGSAVQFSHRSVTPVSGRISVARTASKPYTSRSTTPVTGVISVQNESRPRSALDMNYRSVTNSHHLGYSPNGARPRSAMDSIPMNYPRVTNREYMAYPPNGARPRSAMDSFPVNYPHVTNSHNLAYPPNGSRPRSALDMNYPRVTNSHNLAYPPGSPTGNSYLRSVNAVSPDSAELIGVDGELRDAQKTGNIYHITMSIRPIMSMSRPGSAAVQSFELVDTAIRSAPRRPQSIVSNGPRTSWLLTEDDLGFHNPQSVRPPSSVRISSNQHSSVRPPSSVRMSSNQHSSIGHTSQNPVAFHLELQGGETIQTVSSQSVMNGGDPSYVMDFGRSNELMQEDSFVEEHNGPTTRRHAEEMPNIVRGRILMKNTFDTTNKPQVIDVVEMNDDDDDDSTVIEDNSNMFHGRYMLRKENPLYSSNPDLNRLDDNEDDFQVAEFVSTGVDQPDVAPGKMKVDRSNIGQGAKRGRPTGEQGPARSDRTRSTDYVIPDELEFESLPNGNTTNTKSTTTKTTTRSHHRAGSGGVDDFDRDVMVTRDNQKDRSKSSLAHSGYFGHMQNGEASGSKFMNGGGSRSDINGGGSRSGINGGGSRSGVSMERTSQFSTTSGSRAASQQHVIHDPYENEDFNTEVKVNRDYWLKQRNRASSGGQASMKSMMSSSFAKQHQMSQMSQMSQSSSAASGSLFLGGHSNTLDSQSISNLNIRSLMVGTSSSVKQTIKVDRVEDEILSSIPVDELRRREEAGLGSDLDPASAIFDFDKVSEQVDMDISDGKVTLTSRVRSERTVPIMGSEDMYKKSAVIVTKCIELDMTLTPQRRQLYEMITSRQNGRNGTTTGGTLDKKETFELYTKFAALADLDRAIAN